MTTPQQTIGVPNFTNGQFVDAPIFNSAFGVVSGAVAGMAAAVWPGPGLLYPEAASLTVTGTSLVVSGTFPSPFALLNGSGALATAQGNTTGSTTQAYTVNFAPLVPASGSVTAYLLLSVSTIQENPVGVPGPPPGHPSYNPNFVPTTAYQSVVNTLTAAASTTPADNMATFEFARVTLSAGQTGFTSGAFVTPFQVRAPLYDGRPAVLVSGSYQIPVNTSPYVLTNGGTSGYTSTLPAAQSCGSQAYTFLNAAASGGYTIASTGPDIIYGVQVSGITSTIIPPLSSLTLWSNGTAFYAMASSPSLPVGQFLAPPIVVTGSTTLTSGSLPPGTAGAIVVLIAGGGPGGTVAPTSNTTAGVGAGGGAGSRVAAWVGSGIIGAAVVIGAAGGDTTLTPSGGSAIVAKGGPTGANSGLVTITSGATVTVQSGNNVGSTPIGTNGVFESDDGIAGGYGFLVCFAGSNLPGGFGGIGGVRPGFGLAGLGSTPVSGTGTSAAFYGAGGGGGFAGPNNGLGSPGGVGTPGVALVFPFT